MTRPTDPPPRFPKDHPSPVPEHSLDTLLSEGRSALYRQVLTRRTNRIAVVVEDIYDSHNATAVSRTCDAFGVQRLHVVTQENAFKVLKRVSQGAHRHIDIHRHDTIEDAYAELRRDGFRILVSDLGVDERLDPRQLAATAAKEKVALVFGRESTGISEAGSTGADGFFFLPMLGFTRSLNVSVAVALTLYAVREEAILRDLPGDLPAEEQARLYEQWVHTHNQRAAEEIETRAAEGRNGRKSDKAASVEVYDADERACDS